MRLYEVLGPWRVDLLAVWCDVKAVTVKRRSHILYGRPAPSGIGPSLPGVLHALCDTVNRHDQGVFEGYSLLLG